MAMVNQVLNLSNTANVKDSRWLTLEVCREYQRNKCTRSDTECKFAHPPPHVEVQNGRVTACFDSIKGKCQRKDPPCKYLHPPQHLREQLLQNGRNNLILRNLHYQAVQALNPPLVPGMIPTIASQTTKGTATPIPAIYQAGQLPILIPDQLYGWSGGIYRNPAPYLAASVPPTSVAYNPYSMQTVAVPNHVSDSSVVSQQLPSVIPVSTAPTQQKLARADRLEVCREFQRGTCTRQPCECRYAHPPDNVTVDCSENQVTVCMDFIKGKCTRDSCKYFHPPPHLQAQIKAAQQRANTTAAQAQALPQVVEVIPGKKRPRDHADDIVLQSAMPGMIPFKRVAVPDKNGIPMYQPGANFTQYQQALAMHLQQQQFIPTVAYKNGPQTAVCPSGSQSPAMTLQQQYVPVTMPLVISPAATPEALVAAPASLIPTNVHNINYFDNNQQLLDTLPVCPDFKLGRCNRPACNKVHIIQDYVEATDGRVAVCRDAVRGKCTRPLCKYYHIPIPLPPSK